MVGLGSGDKDALSHLLVCHHEEPWPPSPVCVCVFWGATPVLPVYLGSLRILVIPFSIAIMLLTHKGDCTFNFPRTTHLRLWPWCN